MDVDHEAMEDQHPDLHSLGYSSIEQQHSQELPDDEAGQPNGSGTGTHASDSGPEESRKRVRQDASPHSADEPAAKRSKTDEPTYRTTGRLARKTDQGVKNYDDGTKQSGSGWKPRADHIYPKQDDLQWSYQRPSMGDAVTERMKQNPADQGSYSKTMQVDQAEGGGKLGLKQLGVQRNHTIADSYNARLLTEAYNSNMQPGGAAHQAVNDYISTMAGGAETVEAQKATAAFNQALQPGTRHASAGLGNLKQAINLTSSGTNNMRFGSGAVNGDIGKGADYEHNLKGEISPRSQELRESVLNMAQNGAITHDSAFNAVQPTIKHTGDPGRLSGQYASSSSDRQGYDVGAKWGDMQDPETLRPRDRNHFDVTPANPYGVGQAAEDPTGNLESDRKRKSDFLNE
ncbi:hypothetical protein HNQ77_001212 [Silvibacterium bohemicum]|uniref:Uncharacterized protein n=1 Tax=Silvibacterium bohemicum TaxID=1577686 RepID=A0A841JXV6_9BACT|nr:hypothetical protein [Silvibacterium bohemicum]MBB6143268.1 hypothetical protein [Silvibacterium bohemicum]